MIRPSHPLSSLVRKLAALADLSELDRQALLALPHAVRTIEPHGYVVREGDAPKACGLLLFGFAIRQKLTGQGARQILALHIPGDPVDLQNLLLGESDHSVQTVGRAEVAFVDKAALAELAFERPAVARALFMHTLIEASIFREWILNVGRRAAPARIAHLLCEFGLRLEAHELGDRRRFVLPLTQEQLGDAVGLTPVHVNRTLRQLEQAGLIERRQRQVTVPAWRALREVGDFNQRYLHGEAPESARGLTPELT